MEQAEITKEQMGALTQAMDTILTILGGPSLTKLMSMQEELFGIIAPEHRADIMETIQKQVVLSFSSAVDQSGKLMQEQLQQAINQSKK